MKLENGLSASAYYQELAERLMLLHGRLLAKHEVERNFIATNLNDTVIQSLLGLHIRLISHVHESTAGLDEKGQTDLAESLTIIAELIETFRMMAGKLWPIELDTVGINAALQQASEQFEDLTQVSVTYHGEDDIALSGAAAIALYRLAEELFENIGKHAQATKVQITLRSDDGNVQLIIEDNGRGFLSDEGIEDPLQAPGLGLFGFMVYFQQLNGRLTLQSQPGQGTIVTAVLPRSL